MTEGRVLLLRTGRETLPDFLCTTISCQPAQGTQPLIQSIWEGALLTSSPPPRPPFFSLSLSTCFPVSTTNMVAPPGGHSFSCCPFSQKYAAYTPVGIRSTHAYNSTCWVLVRGWNTFQVVIQLPPPPISDFLSVEICPICIRNDEIKKPRTIRLKKKKNPACLMFVMMINS